MFSIESDKMTSTLYETFSNSIPNWTPFVKEGFDSIISWESYEMTACWPIKSLAFTFYEKLSNSIPNWKTFVKEVSWFDV